VGVHGGGRVPVHRGGQRGDVCPSYQIFEEGVEQDLGLKFTSDP
jgi:hypothetical protein